MKRWASTIAVLGLFFLPLLCGCQSAPRGARHVATATDRIPEVTALYEKATVTTHNVHRFRKPHRDERARLLRELDRACQDMVAALQSDRSSAQALTGNAAAEPTVPAAAEELEQSLGELAAAARNGDDRAMKSAHTSALGAYSRLHDGG